MSTLKLEHIAHIDNAGPDISIDSSGHLNIVNGNLQMGGVTMLDASNGDLSTGNNASVNIRDAAGEVAGRIRNWSSPTNSIAIESDPSNSAAGSYLTFTVDGAQKMTILGNNVGIGTTSPSAPLTIGSGATSRGSYSDLLIAPGGDNAQIEMWGANTSFAISHFDNDRLGIYSNVSGGWGETRGINIKASNGYVGIGTTSPQRMLHIHDGSATGLHITNTQSGAGANDGFSQYIRDDNQATELMVRENSYLGFGTNNQLKVKITNGGILEGISDAEIKTSPIRKHSNTISTNTTIDSSENAIASGPISVATGVTLTINGNMTVV